MIQRRTLLSTLSLSLLAACGRVQSAPAVSPVNNGLAVPAGGTLASLIGANGQVGWLRLTGQVRLVAGNANPQPATLHRAIMRTRDGASAHFFDVWEVAGQAPVAGPSVSIGTGTLDEGQNDAGSPGLWLSRGFSHPLLTKPVEYSRLAASGARVMVIDATRIFLLAGLVMAQAPRLDDVTTAAFAAWKADKV